jgi:hypothetical protein
VNLFFPLGIYRKGKENLENAKNVKKTAMNTEAVTGILTKLKS